MKLRNPSFPSDIKPKQVIRALLKLGFEIHKKRGGHIRLKHADGRWTSIQGPFPRALYQKFSLKQKSPKKNF
jgi:hypothetical protein